MISSSSSTPVTTPSSNSSSNITPKIRPHLIENEASPLFSKEQQIIIQRTKAKLEMEVASFRKRKQILSEQLAHIRSDFLSYGELVQLKASIESNYSSVKTQELNNLMNEYVEIVQGNYELEAECEILIKRIKEESKRRQNEIQLSNQISELFDFSSLSINFPDNSKRSDTSKDVLLKTEISQLEKKLDDIKKEQMRSDIQAPSANIICDAVGSYAKKAESEWQIRSLGSNIIRTQIKNLQKQVIDSTSFINKIEDTLVQEKHKLELARIRTSEAISKAKSSNDSNKLVFEDQLNQMDQTILQIKKDIEMSIIKYDNIMIDIKNLFEESRKILTNDFNANDDDSEDDFSKVVNLGNPTSEVNALMEKKKLLEIEINDLKEKYNSQKASIQKKESILKQKVTKLSRQYINNKQVISVQTKMLIPKQEYNIEKKVSSLINHIDSTILELRSTYA